MPTVEEVFKDPPEFWNDSEDTSNNDLGEDAESPLDNPDKIEPGDRIFMTMVYDPAEFIRATATNLTASF